MPTAPPLCWGFFFWLVQVLRVTVWEFIYEPVCSVVPGKCYFLKLVCDPYCSYFLPPRVSSQIPKSWMEGCDTDTPKAPTLASSSGCGLMYWSMVRTCVCHEESFLVIFLRQTTVGHFHRACDLCSLSNLTVSYNNNLLGRYAHWYSRGKNVRGVPGHSVNNVNNLALRRWNHT